MKMHKSFVVNLWNRDFWATKICQDVYFFTKRKAGQSKTYGIMYLSLSILIAVQLVVVLWQHKVYYKSELKMKSNFFQC